MRFEQLACLIEVAETLSFTEAAKRLFLTKQAVSTNIKQLEQELGRTLIIRDNNRIMLSLAGEKTVAYARNIMQEKDRLLQEVGSNIDDDKILYLHIASTSCVAEMTIPKIIAKLRGGENRFAVKVTQLEQMEQVLEMVAGKEKNIGLISINIEGFQKIFDSYSDILQMEVLANDELVYVINSKAYDGSSRALNADAVDTSLRTMYNVEPVDQWREASVQTMMISSNNSDFHRSMLEIPGAVVAMSGLSYQCFFNSKKYVALPTNYGVTILHAAVYRKDADDSTKEIVSMIRREMYVK